MTHFLDCAGVKMVDATPHSSDQGRGDIKGFAAEVSRSMPNRWRGSGSSSDRASCKTAAAS